MNKTTHGQICEVYANSYANSSVSSVRPHAPFNLSADVQESFLPAWRQTMLGMRTSSLTTAVESLAFGLQLFYSYSTIQKRRRKKIMIAQFSQSAFAWQFQTSDNKAWASHGPCLKFLVFNNFFYLHICLPIVWRFVQSMTFKRSQKLDHLAFPRWFWDAYGWVDDFQTTIKMGLLGVLSSYNPSSRWKWMLIG